MYRILFIALLFLRFISPVQAQLSLSNEGALISVKDGAFISVHGDAITSNNGTWHNSDTIYLFENWINNAGNEAFTSLGEGIVKLYGDDQRIQGTNITRFYDLRLEQTGVKFGDLNVYVDGFLRLNDREFSMDTHVAHVFNTDLSAVTTSNGFVSSLQNGGLLRHTNQAAPYLFPVGSSLGSLRFRPIELAPSSSAANIYKVRHANIDASLEGYDRMIKDSLLCLINPDFYNRIFHNQGPDSVQITLHYDQAADGAYDDMAHWQNNPQWESTGIVTQGFSPTFGLDYIQSNNYISDFTFPAFALADKSDTILIAANAIPSCNGDIITFTALAGLNEYDWFLNDILVQSGPSNIYSSNSLIDGDLISLLARDDDCSWISNIVEVEIFQNSISLTSNITDACAEEPIIFTASSGFLNYDFILNGLTVLQSGPSNIFTSTQLNNGDLITVIATDANCPYESTSILITIFQNMVELQADVLSACQNEAITFTATPGFNNYNFSVNNVSVQNSASNILVLNNLNDGDLVTVIADDANCPYTSVALSISIFQNSIDLSANTLQACPNTPITFIGTPGFNNYDFLVNNVSVQNGPANVFASSSLSDGDVIQVIGTDDNCPYESITIQVEIFENEVVLSSDIQIACTNESVNFSASTGFTNYEFFVNNISVQSGPSNTYTAVIPDGSQVTVVASDANCSYTSNSININTYDNTLELEVDSPSTCQGNFQTFTANTGFDNYEFLINNQTVQNGNDNTLSMLFQNGDEIQVIATDGLCDYVSTIIPVIIYENPLFLISDKLESCQDEVVLFSASSGLNNYDFYINDFLAQSGNDNVFITYDLTPNDLVYVIANTNQCTFSSDSLAIVVNPLPSGYASNDTTIAIGTSAEIFATGGINYAWEPDNNLTCPTCPNIEVSPEITTAYEVSIYNEFECAVIDSVLITVVELDEEILFIPNAITPNGDGINDVWNIKNLQLFENPEVGIVNRWGDEVFSARPYNNDFNGNWNAGKLPAGTYYYILKLGPGFKVQKGPLTIIRE